MRQEGVLKSQLRRWNEAKCACARGMADFSEANERVVHVTEADGRSDQGSLRIIQVVQLDSVGGKPLPGGRLDLDQASQDDLKRIIGIFSLDRLSDPVRTDRIVVHCKSKDPAPWDKFPAALASRLRVRCLAPSYVPFVCSASLLLLLMRFSCARPISRERGALAPLRGGQVPRSDTHG
jgi:hypothetical protein